MLAFSELRALGGGWVTARLLTRALASTRMDVETTHGVTELLVFREFVEHSKIAVVPGKSRNGRLESPTSCP